MKLKAYDLLRLVSMPITIVVLMPQSYLTS